MEKPIGTCLTRQAQINPDKTALSFEGGSYTWGEMDRITDLLAQAFLAAGIKPKIQVAIWGLNTPNWVFAYYALIKLGAVPVLLNTCYKGKELLHVLNDSRSAYLLYDSVIKNTDQQAVLKELEASWQHLAKAMIPLSRFAAPGQEYCSEAGLLSFAAAAHKRRLEQAKQAVDAEDTASILYTSGTTSKPKGVMLTHANLMSNSRQLVKEMRWNQQDKFCVAVPLFHCFGITAGLLPALHTGACVHLLKHYKTMDVIEQIEKYRCSVLNGVPTMFLALARRPERRLHDLSSLKSGIIAGSPILAGDYERICRELAMPFLQPSYGQTESSPCVTIAGYEDALSKKAVSAGRAIAGVEVKILNPQQRRDPAGAEVGEIITRGPHVMKGYYNNPAATRQVIDRDGWLHTGDLGFIDEDGCLHVTGRIKEMIIRGGENIAPLEIEGCISQMAEVAQVKVVGTPAAVMQEEITACVITEPGKELTGAQVKAWVRARLADYKVPRYVLFFDDFPTTSNGKIKISELKQKVSQLLAEMTNN